MTGRSAAPGGAPSTLRQALGQLARLLRLVRPYWSLLARGVVLGVLASLLGVAVPYVSKLLIDEVYPTGDVTLLHVLVAALVAFSVGSTVVGTLRGLFAGHVQTRLVSAVRLMFFNHLQHLPMRFFDTHQVGEVASRFQGAASGVAALGRVLEVVFTQGLFLLLVPPMLLLLDVRLGLLALTVVPLVTLVSTLASGRLRRQWQASSEAAADLTAYQVEVLSNIRMFKGFAREDRTFAAARLRVDRAMAAQLRALGTAHGLAGLTGALRAASMAALTWYGWLLILRGDVTLGDFVAFTAYVAYLYQPLFLFIDLFSQLQESCVHVGRTFEYLDEAPEQEPARAWSGEAVPALAVAGGYRLEGVSFAYDAAAEDRRPALDRLDLELPAGAVTAVVGPSGSGKTSLLRLLCALERPSAGRILLDGRPLESLPLAAVRRRVAVVWQEPSLLRGTLWDNLILGCDEPPATVEVERAVHACGLAEVVEELPGGLHGEVAEWGASLSAGQQQRVALARALLRRTSVLLLDEATANVDVETADAVLAALLELYAGRTVVFVTHRLATAAVADRILVLERGRLAAQGTHAGLLATCPLYRRLQETGEREPQLRAAAGGVP